MLKLDALRVVVDQRLRAVIDDIFRRFARTITEYEEEVFQLKREIERERRLLETAGRPEDRAAGVLQLFPTEEEQQVRGRSLSQHFKPEEDGASGPQDTDTKFTPSPDWLRERPEKGLSPPSNQIQSCRVKVGPRPANDKKEAFSVKQEVGEVHIMLLAAGRTEIGSQQEGWYGNPEEERLVSGRSFGLHIKQEGGGASGPEDTDIKTTLSPDCLFGSNDDKGSSLSNQMQSHIQKEFLPAPSNRLMIPGPRRMCRPPDHHRDSDVQSESSSENSDNPQSEPGFQRTQGSGTQSPVEQKLLVCGSCGREFSSRRTLRKHIRQNTAQDQDQMSCSLRKQRAPFQSPAKSFSCRVCGSSFYTRGILVRHAENHCKEPESRCGACGDYLESTETLRDHLRSHKELGSTCDVCGKKCSSIRRMEIHKRVHTGEKPYHCRFCSRDFSRKESLERHLKVHSGDRPHCCGLCRRTFTRRENLARHLKTLPGDRTGNVPGQTESSGARASR
ncbi:zinc finger protein 662-like [Xiphias gladius]|uniref:zinc finger protein 662-like n=1 Tax=Xiphias gladius TaxID=8245 RepID=UPI001A99A847|nr:zinc finger protein 662-like [Xiphias gladius]